ncbi:helix-turn-helix transcriptional regulator [Phycicoccus avicenniae]|uniref:helix-turn-helix transcriptional regulator n=1 Tax=Phycicoccus avicenniae TaxID=2828860 RepID=UPI003D2831F9
MSAAVRLQVEGVDLQNEETLERLAMYFHGLLWGSTDGIVTATVFTSSSDPASEVVEAAREIEHRLPKAQVRRVQRDLVTQSDIASRVGVSREAVRKWTQRTSDAFPTPFATVGSDVRTSRVWQWADVVEWLERVYGMDMNENLASEPVLAQVDACLAKAKSYLDRRWQTVSEPGEVSRPLVAVARDLRAVPEMVGAGWMPQVAFVQCFRSDVVGDSYVGDPLDAVTWSAHLTRGERATPGA